MFDIGFWELAVLAVVGIVVVGPDKLPEVVRTVAVTLRKLRRMFSDIKADIEHELDLDDMRKILQEADMQAHINKINHDIMAQETESHAPESAPGAGKYEIHHESDSADEDGFSPEDAQKQQDTEEEAPNPQDKPQQHHS